MQGELHHYHRFKSTTSPTELRDRFIDWLDNVDWKDVGLDGDGATIIPFAKGANAGKKTFRQVWGYRGRGV